MRQITDARRWLEQAAGVVEALEAAWAGFDLIVAACERGLPGAHELFPSFAFAAAAAAEGRTILASAPSLPAGPVASVRCEEEPDADALAGLAEALHSCLSQAPAG